jgi:hypothetical protein
MVKTISLTIDVPDNREMRITLPDDVPTGPAEIVVVVASHAATALQTLGELASSEFFGMWSNRDDITDSAEFARQLRNTAWSRGE